MSKVTLYGKPDCPYSTAAREDLDKREISYDYIDVSADPKALAEMVRRSGGQKVVPVIVENESVKVGFGGT